MAVKLAYHPSSNNTVLIAGYEGGFTAVHLLPRTRLPTGKSIPKLAQAIYLSQPHTQPVLSLDALPDPNMYFTSSADAVIAAHRIPEMPLNIEHGDGDESLSSKDIENAGQIGQALSDQPSSVASTNLTPNPEIMVDPTAPSRDIDGLAPSVLLEPSAQEGEGTETVKANASSEPLDISREPIAPSATTSPLSFSKQTISSPSHAAGSQSKSGGLSSLLSSAAAQPQLNPSPPAFPAPIIIQPPHKTINTKHSGQQSLRVRSDGRLFVTGGWDSRVRIYSTKTLKEMAVLKWHKEGVYAVDFGEVLGADDPASPDASVDQELEEEQRLGGDEVAKRETGLGRLQRQREERMQLKHWVVAGAKDGKVSLWEVF